MMNALILAGEDHRNKLGTSIKALIDIHGKPMVQYVISNLRKCGKIDQIGIIGPYEKLHPVLQHDVDHIIDGKESIVRNTIEGIYHLGEKKELLLCTCDIPLLTVEAVTDFIDKARNANAELCYPIVEKKESQKKFPGMERTYVKIKEGDFTGGNIFYIRPCIVRQCGDKAEQLITHRKNALKMAKVLGWKTLSLLLLKQLTIPQAEKRFSEIFSIKARAIVSHYPELANDVDKPSDLEYVRELFKVAT